MGWVVWDLNVPLPITCAAGYKGLGRKRQVKINDKTFTYKE